MTRCPGCGVEPTARVGVREATPWASAECLSAHDEVLAYTLGLGDAFFLHQIAVDAYAASHASGARSSITTAFALIGLCLVVEREYSGRRVQLAHMHLAERRRDWPRFEGPAETPSMTVVDVLDVPPGEARDEAIREWGRVVWAAWGSEQERVRRLIDELNEERLFRRA